MTLNKAVVLLAAAVLLGAESGHDLFQKGLAKERADADPRGAIKIYEQVVRQNGKDKKLASQALIRMGECYTKLGDIEARRVYERVLREFGDQAEAVATARARLAGDESKNGGIVTRQIWAGRGVDTSGTPSPDGRYLSYIHWETGDLAVRDLTTGTNRMLTNTGGWEKSGDFPGESVFSPDGREIAYIWFLAKEGATEVRVISLTAGENPRPKTVIRTAGWNDAIAPHGWSPDGKELLVVRTQRGGASQIAMLAIRDGSLRVVKKVDRVGRDSRLAPNGKYIAYSRPESEKSGQPDIYVITTDGTRETVIAPSSAADFNPVWTPDGSGLIFLSGRTGHISMWSVRIEDGNPATAPELVKDNAGPIRSSAITRNGVLYYSLSGSSVQNVQIAEVDRDLKPIKPPTLAGNNRVNSSSGPEWAPDGKSLAYLSNDPARGTFLMIRSQTTGVEREVVVKAPIASIFFAGPRWFPDGNSVLLTGRRDRQGMPFYKVDVNTGEASAVHWVMETTLSSYELAPDGKSIYYALQTIDMNPSNVTGQLRRFDIGGSTPSVLLKDRWFISISLSPDGKQLAFLESVRPGSASSISVMPASGGDAREVFLSPRWDDGSRYNTLTWSADGRQLIFVRGGVMDRSPNKMWRVPVHGGAAELTGLETLSRIKSPTVHPDGRWLAFGTTESDSGEIWTLANFLGGKK